jgi:hypothetical protein
MAGVHSRQNVLSSVHSFSKILSRNSSINVGNSRKIQGNDGWSIFLSNGSVRTFMTNGKIDGLPLKSGLYDPALEKDSCGVGFVVDVKGL